MVMRNIWRKSAIALIVITTSLVVHGGRNQGNSELERDASWLDLNEDFNDPHMDHRSSKQSSARQKTSGDNNSVDKRDRAPPKSPKYSSLSAKAVLERAESVLEGINEKGCPTAEENLFNVTVYTADLRLAATTSQVYINIYGMVYGVEESTTKIHLTNHNMKEFTRGRVDSFLLKTKFVGLVERITIEHDNTGVLPDWNLDKVVVHDLKLGTIQTFICYCELAGYENEVSLPPI